MTVIGLEAPEERPDSNVRFCLVSLGYGTVAKRTFRSESKSPRLRLGCVMHTVVSPKSKEGCGEFNRSTQIYFVASPQVSGSRVFSAVVHSASLQIHLTAPRNSPINRSSSGSTGATDDWCSRCCLFARGSAGHRNKPACRSQA